MTVRRAALLGSAVLAACASVPRGPPGLPFPDGFAATQVVVLHGDGEPVPLLASVWREGPTFRVAFLDAALQVPLLTARLDGETFSEKRLVSFPLPSREVEALLRDVAALYASRAVPAGDGVATVEVGRWVASVSAVRGPPGCRFPDRVVMRPRGGAAPWIEVTTLDVRCDTDR